MGKGCHHDGVPIGRALGHGVHSDDGAGARLVFDDNRLAERLGHARPQGAGNEIRPAAGGKRNNQANRLFRKGGVCARDGARAPKRNQGKSQTHEGMAK